jgi:DNA-binding transcriptional regulator PaaX
MGYYLNETTFTDELIAFLFSCRSNSIRKKILWERVQKRHKMSRLVFNQSMYRLNNKGIITNKGGVYKLSNRGIALYKNPYRRVMEKPSKVKKIIIIFDIPENKKKVREWLRRQIKDWDFEMIQKSVWIGFGPLPEEFTKRLKILGVEKGVRIFNVQSK